MKRIIKNLLRQIILKLVPEISKLKSKSYNFDYLMSYTDNVKIGNNVSLGEIYRLNNVKIGDGTYISLNSMISFTIIGKYCSIGPNFFCGWGIHPIDGISTSPMFYSTKKQNGITLSSLDKIEERKPIVIGNDVFIGANVTVLDGITIGDGAIVGAGSVVSKNIPPYAIAVGCPIKVIRYRFDEKQIEALLRIKWWNFTEDKLQDIEKLFFDIETFLKTNDTIYSNSKL
jgi:virginiamycin A acetyltransferase